MNWMDILKPDAIMIVIERVVVLIIFITTSSTLTYIHVRETIRQIGR